MCHHLNANSNMMRPHEERERNRKDFIGSTNTWKTRVPAARSRSSKNSSDRMELHSPKRMRIIWTRTLLTQMNRTIFDSNAQANYLIYFFSSFDSLRNAENIWWWMRKHTDTHIRYGVRYRRTSQSQTQTQPHTSTGYHRNEYRWHWWKWMMRATIDTYWLCNNTRHCRVWRILCVPIPMWRHKLTTIFQQTAERFRWLFCFVFVVFNYKFMHSNQSRLFM